jgi:hypothetical protein
MDTVAKADIFFFVTTIFVGILAVAAIVVAVYVVKILRDLKDISTIVKSETEQIATDVEHLRLNVRRHGFNFPAVVRFIKSIFSGKRKDVD